MNNPFILTFGREPINFIPRIDFIQEVKDNFLSETMSNQAYMITGVRGTGKTVLMTKLIREFEDKKDWVIVDLNPERDMLQSLASQLYNNSLSKHLFLKAELNLSFNGVGFSIGIDKPSNDIEKVINKIVHYLNSKGVKILITIDDATSNENIKVFAHTYQGLIRKNYAVFMLMSGLYENISSIQKNKALTFLSRVPKLVLKPLYMPAIKESYIEVFNVEEDVAIKMTKLTEGYAYAYQVLGYLMWNSHEKKITKNLLAQYDHYLAEFVYDRIWEKLSENERLLLKSLAEIEKNDISKIKENLSFSDKEISVYRDRLIKAGLLVSKQRGKIQFVLPRFKEYIYNINLFS